MFSRFSTPWLMIGLIASVAIACAPRSEPEGSPKPAVDSILITDATIVLPVENRVTEPRDILVSEGKIVEVAAAGSILPSLAASVIDAEGLYALAGLIDVHAHIGDGGRGAQSEVDRQGALGQFIRYGVTTIFAPGGGGGNDHQLASWKDRCAAGEFPCPGLYGSGALITAPGSHPIGTIWGFDDEADPARVYERGGVALAEDAPVGPLLDRKMAMGVDGIKIIVEDGIGPRYPMPRLSKAKIASIVDEAHSRGLQVFAHVSQPQHIADAVEGGVDGVMHSSERPIPDVVLDKMARQEIFYVATLSLYDGFIDHAFGLFEQEPFALAGVSPRALASLEDEAWRNSPHDTQEEALAFERALEDNIRRVAEAGVPLALGTDTNNATVFPGYSAHEELALMVKAGLSPARALAAATAGGAAFLQKEKTLGRIATGYEADILLLAGNPLEDILLTRALHTVLDDGRLVAGVVSLHETSGETKP